MSSPSISPEQFNDMLLKGELTNDYILDVRGPQEWEYYHLEEAVLIPMQTIPERLDELPQDQTIYVLCAHGVRSNKVTKFLHSNGFTQAVNVQGGMAAVSGLRGFAYD